MHAKTPLLLAILIATPLAGCLGGGDDATGPGALPSWAASRDPSYEDVQPSEATGLEYVARLRHADGTTVDSGGGIVVWGDHVFGSGRDTGWWLADVSDPAAPVLVFHDAEGQTPYSRDMDLVFHPDGRVTLAIATQSYGMHFWDVTDIDAPVWAGWADVHLNHNLAVVPGTEYVFNSVHRGEGKHNELVDASDPYDPRVVGTYGEFGCHHHYFWVDPASDELSLAACAAVERTEIWDMSGFDPEAPDFGIVTLGVVEFGTESPILGNPAFSRHPVDEWHHSAFISDDGQTLIVGSELNGAASPGGCYVYDDTTGASDPVGALWFYDISDRTSPQLLSWLAPEHPDYILEPPLLQSYEVQEYLMGQKRGCTSHFGTFLPGEDKMVVGWYTVGTVLVDFTDPASPRILDHYQAHTTSYSDSQLTWDAWVHGGYVFTGDIERGMDVLRLV